MSITSPSFLLAAALTLLLYFLLPGHRLKRLVLLAADGALIICMSGGVQGLIWVLLLTAAGYLAGLGLEKAAGGEDRQRAKQKARLLYLSLVPVLGILLYFKFFRGSWGLLQERLLDRGITLADLLAPIGLSYFTLAISGYLIDVSHKKHPAERSFWDFLLYVSFFPALMQGPINLYRKLMPQLKEDHPFDRETARLQLYRILWGYFKKTVIADRIGIRVAAALGDAELTGFPVFWTMVLYSFQIYCDFSGGIDVIMGISRILGIRLQENFDAPFRAKSVTEFWSRWHKSLGEWMEKYVYYPLILSKPLQKLCRRIGDKRLRASAAAAAAGFLVFILVGIWHGTGWNYVVYGLYQAAFVSSATLLGPFYKRTREKWHISEKSKLWQGWCVLRTFIVLVFGRYLTRGGTLTGALALLRRTFASVSLGRLFDGSLLSYGLDMPNTVLMLLLILGILMTEFLGGGIGAWEQKLTEMKPRVRLTLLLAGLLSILLFGIYGRGYDAAAFIYQSF